ncbi:MAG: hypothetical protein JST22_15310 [Bacteroidetes bacterium]|nr:hypothetical protein [Bacteroidota bacterium]
MPEGFISVADALPYWPGSDSVPSFLQDVFLVDYVLDSEDGRLWMTATVTFDSDLEFDLFGVRGIRVGLLAANNVSGIPMRLDWEPDFALDLSTLALQLTLDQDILRRVKPAAGGGWEADMDGNTRKPVQVTVSNVGFVYRGGLDIELAALEAGASISMTPAEIGDTGIVLQFSNIIPVLSRNQTPPPGCIPGFKGVYIGQVKAGLPASWQEDPGSNAEIVGTDLTIGTGGFSGTLSLALKSGASGTPAIGVNIGGAFALSLDSFKLTFKHNRIASSEISGTLTVPGFTDSNNQPAKIGVRIGLTEQGITITALATSAIKAINIKDVFSFSINSLSVGSNGGRYFIALSGVLDITAAIPGVGGRFLDDPLEIKKLVIWSNGEIDFDGGTIPLPKIKPLKVGPVEISVAALHIGSYKQVWGGQERRYKFIGFDAGVKTGIGGVDAHGQGIKFYFTVDNGPGRSLHTFLRIDGIRVHLMIPGSATKETADLILDGYISAKNRENSSPPALQPGEVSEQTDPATEYAGGVSFAMPKTGLAGGADIRMTPSTGAFLADVRLELPRGIPLANTGLGIYGFRGTFANKYVLEKDANESWWEFYKKPERGIHAAKFKQRDGFSVGAGVTIGTLADSGFAFSAKIYFMLSIPTAFLLQGEAAIMQQRLGLDTESDPPFFATIIVDFEQGGITAGIGAHIELPDGGDVLEIDADMEVAFYMGRTDMWHLYIGQEDPDKRVRGTLLKLANCWAYFMLSASGIKAGAGVEYKAKIDCGIASVALGASMEVTGFVNFRPIQLGGHIGVAGFVQLKLFGIGFRLEARATLDAEAPNPFIIQGGFVITLDLPWPIPNVSLSVYLSWRIHDNVPKTEVGFLAPPHPAELTDDHLTQFAQTFDLAAYNALGKYAAKAVHMVTSEAFLLNVVKHEYIPRDPGGVAPYAPTPPPPTVDNGNNVPVPGMGEWIGDFRTFTVPVDSVIDIEFNKPVKPVRSEDDPNGSHASIDRLGLIQGSPTFWDLVPPKRGASNQVEHQYLVDNVRVFFWDDAGHAWQDYAMPLYNTPLRRIAAVNQISQQELESSLKVGHFQLTQVGQYTKLRILARTPFDQNDTLPPIYGGFPPTVVLCPDTGAELTCHNWEDDGLPATYAPDVKINDRRIAFTIHDQQGAIVPYARFNLTKALKLQRGNSMEIFLPENSRQIDIRISAEADRVAVSYYRGQAYTPSNDPPAVSGNTVRWQITAPPPPGLVPRDGVWEMLMNLPATVRTLCTGAGSPQPSGATTSLTALLDQKYFLTDSYLKQNNNEAQLPANADFCTKLRSMFRTFLIGKTGSTSIPRRLAVNADHFYSDVKGYVTAYRAQFGEPALGGLAAASDSYEKWRGLIVCLGKLCDLRNTLPGDRNDIRERMARTVDPAIARLYHKLNDSNWFSQQVNARTWLGSPSDQLTAIAGFISIICLDLGASVCVNTLTTLEPYYAMLERAYLRVARGLRRSDNPSCGVDGCGVQEMVGIARTLCVDPQVSGATLTAITTLVGNFESTTLAALHSHLGWAPAAASGTALCNVLLRVLPPVIVAYSAFDELPFTLRWKVSAFHDELLRLVDIYRSETLLSPKGTPDHDTDAFAQKWNAMLSCLCALAASGNLPEESYVQTSLDPQLKTAYDILSDSAMDQLVAATPSRRPLYGTRVAADAGDRASELMEFFSAAYVASGRMTNDMRSKLDARYTALMSNYQTFVNTLIGSTFCGGLGSLTLNCGTWPALLECVRTWRARQAEMLRSIRDAIDSTLAPKVQSLYMTLKGYTNANQIVVPSEFEPMAFELDELIAYFRRYCLQGLDVPLQAAMQTDLAALQNASIAIVLNPDFVNADSCEASGTNDCSRRSQVIGFYTRLCGAPPANPGPTWPSTAINTLVDGFATNANEIAALLGLAPISFTRGASRTFCDIFGDLVQLLVTAYGALEELPLRYPVAIRTFVDAMSDAVAQGGFSVPTFATPSPQTTCNNWVDVLGCICTAYRYQDTLQYFNGATSAFNAVIGELEQVYADALVIADAMSLDFLPYRAMSSRAGRVHLLANAIAIASLDYSVLPATMALLTNQTAFESAYDNAALDSARSRTCTPAPGPYDPLRKRVVVSRDAGGNLISYMDGDEPIDRIVIEPLLECPAQGECATYVHSVCWLSDADFDYNAGLPPAAEQLQAGREMAFSLKNLTQPIWRPNTIFALQLETREVVGESDGNNFTGSTTEYRRTFTFGFRTAGPPGHFHIETQVVNNQDVVHVRPEYQSLLDADREGEYRYGSLRTYINREKSYPDPDGNLVDAKPLYYDGAKLQLIYDVDYVDSMYSVWETAIGVPEVRSKLQTVIAEASRGANDPEIVIEAGWENDAHPTVRSGMRTFRNMMKNIYQDGKECLEFDPVDQDRPVRSTSVPMTTLLKPRTLYTALFNAVYQENPTAPERTREVHRYVFTTSRYRDFMEHVESFYLDAPANTRRAVTTIDLTVDDSGIDMAALFMSAPNDPTLATLARDYPDPYDRVVSGMLRLRELPPPTCTDVLILRKGTRVVGFLVRSPEPFNHPKIPRVQVAQEKIASDTLMVTLANPAATAMMLFSKDLSGIFVTNAALNMQHGTDVTLDFTHLAFGVTEYLADATATLTFTVPA